MSKHDDAVSLRHMRDHAREAIAMLQGCSRSDLDSNRMLSLALIQLAQIMGEAANRVSKLRPKRHPEIPWSQIIGPRNRLVHGYDVMDFDILWQILTADLPEPITKLEKIVPSENP
jgi:uncharacterized protein with HEPN domain